ncbi:hypothetical protein PAUR_b0448 [Pseudoalteromonas aurantia 208]|uniref:Uncharacterized protein n=1 Tax=Pseudoalteromonas aurantia 208 TaxID=1314867 RepID=A0ABR9EHE7_9GAMM|nr:hypothetical protein [Pseudoalteromonas aurantia 208]
MRAITNESNAESEKNSFIGQIRLSRAEVNLALDNDNA